MGYVDNNWMYFTEKNPIHNTSSRHIFVNISNIYKIQIED